MEEPQASDDAHLLPPGGDRSLDDLSSPPRMDHETTKAPTDPLPQRTWWQAFIAFCDIVFYYPLQVLLPRRAPLPHPRGRIRHTHHSPRRRSVYMIRDTEPPYYISTGPPIFFTLAQGFALRCPEAH